MTEKAGVCPKCRTSFGQDAEWCSGTGNARCLRRQLSQRDAEIAVLRANNETMREALEKIVPDNIEEYADGIAPVRIALTALKQGRVALASAGSDKAAPCPSECADTIAVPRETLKRWSGLTRCVCLCNSTAVFTEITTLLGPAGEEVTE
jgi:hypothetical protein